jgi:hypothetical protein
MEMNYHHLAVAVVNLFIYLFSTTTLEVWLWLPS